MMADKRKPFDLRKVMGVGAVPPKKAEGGPAASVSEAQPEERARPSMPLPLTETQAETRQVDLTDVAKADADNALDEARTVEMAVRPPKAPPAPVPAAVRAPPPKREAKVVQLMPKAAEPEQKPGEAAALESEAAPIPAAAPAPEKKGFDAEKLLARIKSQVEDLLAPITARLDDLTRRLGEIESARDSIIDEIEGPETHQDEVLGLRQRLASLEEVRDIIIDEIEGPMEPKLDGQGNPVLGLKERLSAVESVSVNVFGEGYERFPSFVQDNVLGTAKQFAKALLRNMSAEELASLAATRGPPTSREALENLAESEEFSFQVVAMLSNNSGIESLVEGKESLELPENRKSLELTVEASRRVTAGAKATLESLDWEAVERQALDLRAPEVESNGGDE